MRFVSRKPSLPIGTLVPGFPAVQKALHADDSCEVYRLEAHPRSSLVLIVVPVGSEPLPVTGEQLIRWWTRMGPERVSVKQIFESGGVKLGAFQAVLQVTGEWVGTEGSHSPEEPDLYALLTALVGLAEEGIAESFLPSFQPSLLWKSGEASMAQVASLHATVIGDNSESLIIRDIGSVIYWLATRIDLTAVSSRKSPPLLSQWCKTVGPQLSGLIARCIDRGNAVDRITSLTALRAEVARQLSGDRAPAPASRPSLQSPTLPGIPEPQMRGLAKVAGMHDLKRLLEKEVIRPLRDPEPFRRYGLTIPNGILLYGPPGCGKTYIARQLAEELGYFFTEVIPSEVASPYIHQSVLRIRDLFETAAERAPAVVFIDEFEALVPSRAELGGHQQYKSEEVNEFLAHLNACAEKKIFVIAATNEPEKIDLAVRRTGRLDKLIYVGPPDAEARAEMLRLHLAHRFVEDSVDVSAVAGTLEGYSASDIKFLVDEAARDALERGVPISTDILIEARRRVPPSVTKEEERRFKAFVSRGI